MSRTGRKSLQAVQEDDKHEIFDIKQGISLPKENTNFPN